MITVASNDSTSFALVEATIFCLLLERRHETLCLWNRHGQTASCNARTELTAASSGGRAPFAILCFPNLSRCVGRGGSLFVPSCGTSRASHSSRLATCPPRSEKNLCRSTVLIRSKPCVEYHPSRSCIDTTVRDVSKLRRGQAYIADLSEVFLIFDHLLQHRVGDVAQLESGRLLRDSHAVEYMRSSQDNQYPYRPAPIAYGVPSVILRPSLRPALCKFCSALLPLADDGGPDDGVVGVTEIETLVAAPINQSVIYFGSMHRERPAYKRASRS